MSMKLRRAIVIGGGIIGTACAHYLARAGWSVTVIDRGPFGEGCSSANCGFVCPSHVLPLAEPGAIGPAIRSMFQKNAPFAIRPRLDPALWSWLLNFARRCNRHDMLEAGVGIQALLESSLALYEELVERERLECEWQRRGLFFVYKSPAAFDAYAETNRLLAESFECPAERIEGARVEALEPALRDGMAGGWYYHDDAHLRPDKLLRSWRRLLENDGVTIREQCALEGFAGRSQHAAAVKTSQGEIPAEVFVAATGALTPLLNEHLGCKIPIQPGKGYSITMPRPASCPAIPLIFPETRVAVTPFASGYRLGSTMEFAGYDATIDPKRLQILKDGAEPYLRTAHCEPVERTWFGWRPMTYDGLPIIDRAPRYENVWVAAGHNMLGLSMAPATGKLLAELVGGERPFLDPDPYRISRF